MGIPKRTATQELAYYIRDKILNDKSKSKPSKYGELKAILEKSVNTKTINNLTVTYKREFNQYLKDAISDGFYPDPAGYAKKLVTIIENSKLNIGVSKPGKALPSWPAGSERLLEKRLTYKSLWPQSLPQNILIYKTQVKFYEQFKNWGLWYLKNHSNLEGLNFAKPGSGQYKAASPLPKNPSDNVYGDLEFFKNLHSYMNTLIQDYRRKNDLPHRDVFGAHESQRAKSRIAKRSMAQAKKFLALFEKANKGVSGQNMFEYFKAEVEKLEKWQKDYGHLK